MLCILNLKKVKASRSPATGGGRRRWVPYDDDDRISKSAHDGIFEYFKKRE